jgi:hypothetical protein
VIVRAEGEVIMGHQAECIWRYGGIDIVYTPEVDGGGAAIAPPMVDLIRNRFGKKHRFGTVFEWCAGPGFIGFALLAEGMCDSLCLADINSEAIDCANRSIKLNKLQNRVHAYVSDNLESVPVRERFDLVVGNPPSFCAGNSAHPADHHLKGNIRGYDPDWKLRRGFYSKIAPFLSPGALLLVLEVNLYEREVFSLGSEVPFDVRPEEPQPSFVKMIRQGGLSHVEDVPFDPGWQTGFKFWVQISQKRT